MRQRWWVGVLALALSTTAAGAAEDSAFVSGIDDLPLMAGLVEEEGSAMVFDSPAGRIVETEAAGPLARADVVTFYAATLPALGWRRQGETTFIREGESLRLEIAERGNGLVVHFVLAPAGR